MEPTGYTAHEPGSKSRTPSRRDELCEHVMGGAGVERWVISLCDKGQGLGAGGMSSLNENINFEMESLAKRANCSLLAEKAAETCSYTLNPCPTCTLHDIWGIQRSPVSTATDRLSCCLLTWASQTNVIPLSIL